MNSEQQNLREFVETLLAYSALVNEGGSTIIRRTHSLNNFVGVYVCSPVEPHDVLLPVSCYWINTDQESSEYKTILFRTGTESDGTFTNTWVPIDLSPQSIWHKSTYADNDTLSTNLDVASVSKLGTVQLSTQMDSDNPIALVEGDSSLEDARLPLPHEELHAEIPASALVTNLGDYGIDRSLFGNNKFFVAGSSLNVDWSYLSLPVPGYSVLPTPSQYDEASLKRISDLDSDKVSNIEVYLV